MNTTMLFSIGIKPTMNGKTLKGLTPDSDGVYKKIPSAILGQVSRNKAEYDVPSFMDCMTNPERVFYKRLTEGNLRGEVCHPMVFKREDIQRIPIIDRTKVSHAITQLYTEKTKDGNMIVIYIDVKPTGPYGKELDDTLRDPLLNVGFSLRSLTSLPVKRPDGVMYKKMVSLITFDVADMPGYEQASKRYSGGMESIKDYELDIDDVMSNNDMVEMLGLESGTKEELFNLLGSDTISIHGMDNYVMNNDSLYKADSQTSIFHTIFR